MSNQLLNATPAPCAEPNGLHHISACLTSIAPVVVIGQIGIDVLLQAAEPFSRGTKIGAEKTEAPGYFGLNVTSHLLAEGISSILVTAVGDDEVADRIVSEAKERGVRLLAAHIAGHGTACSYVLVEDGAVPERTVFRITDCAANHWTEMPWSLIENEAIAWLVLGHLPGDVDGAITRRLIQAAYQASIPVSWTPGNTQIQSGMRNFASELKQLRLLVMNIEEAISFCGLSRDFSVLDATMFLASHAGPQTLVVVTNGGKSPALCYDNASRVVYSAPALSIPVVDPTGAGDAFHAGMVANLVRGVPIKDALDRARRKAAAVCAVWGGGWGQDIGTLALLRPASPITLIHHLGG